MHLDYVSGKWRQGNPPIPHIRAPSPYVQADSRQDRALHLSHQEVFQLGGMGLPFSTPSLFVDSPMQECLRNLPFTSKWSMFTKNLSSKLGPKMVVLCFVVCLFFPVVFLLLFLLFSVQASKRS